MFRLAGGVKHSSAIDLWFDQRQPDLGDIARSWFAHMRRCGDGVRELLHDGCPVACLGDAPFAYVNAFKAHVNVGFFFGAELPDPAGLLEGTGRRMRHVKVRPGANFDAEALAALIDAAYLDLVWRLEAE
jgi:hypothetical protein